MILHTYVHHVRYILNADLGLAGEIYDLFKEDLSTLDEDDAETEKSFAHEQRGALALTAAAVCH